MSRPNPTLLPYLTLAADAPDAPVFAGLADPDDAADVALYGLDPVRDAEELRQAKVDRLRRAVRAGAYDNELKFSVAVDRMLEGLDMGGRESGVGGRASDVG